MKLFSVLIVGLALAVAACAPGPEQAPLVSADYPCLPWVDFPTDRYSNADSPFYGCISAANLRAMVEQPGDLDVGRALGPANGDQQTRAIQAYRLGRVKAFQGASASGASSGGSSGGSSGASSGGGP